jgi:hypothetical protein
LSGPDWTQSVQDVIFNLNHHYPNSNTLNSFFKKNRIPYDYLNANEHKRRTLRNTQNAFFNKNSITLWVELRQIWGLQRDFDPIRKLTPLLISVMSCSIATILLLLISVISCSIATILLLLISVISCSIAITYISYILFYDCNSVIAYISYILFY